MRVFLDANILFSAANSKWLTHDFVELLLRHADCLTNAYAAEEARRNLTKHFPKHVAQLDQLLSRLQWITVMADDLGVDLKEKDRPILGGAVAGQATHLLTGDRKDFGPLFGKSVHGVKIVDQATLSAELVAGGLL
jgi:predicted nucleic acid-binding protein